MGGDGGVIASNRRYMRGAGTADHTGDASRKNSSSTMDPQVLQEQQARDFKTCAVSNQPLDYSLPIVCCPYGRLYDKEKAVQALLQKDERLSHVRGLKDLFDVRFYLTTGSNIISCPITEKELSGKIPAFVILPGNNTAPHPQPNVISERGLQMKELLEEYGPIERTLRLVPPPGSELEKKMQEEWQQELLLHKKKSKRKRDKDKKTKRQQEHKKARSESEEKE